MTTGALMFWKNRKLETVKQILARRGGGIYKRIDENRELLELLQKEAPDLLEKQPWIVGWLESQDDFLCELESAVPLSDVQFRKQGGVRCCSFPRPWPLATKPHPWHALVEAAEQSDDPEK